MKPTMDEGFTCMRNGCYWGKARVVLKKVLAYPFLYLNAFIPIFDQMACHFSKQSYKTKKNLSWFQPEIFMVFDESLTRYYLNDLSYDYFDVCFSDLQWSLMGKTNN